MLADAGEGDVLDHHHLVVAGLERDLQMTVWIVLDAAEDLAVHVGDPCRRRLESVAVRVLADGLENLANGLLDTALVDAVELLAVHELCDLRGAGVRAGPRFG